MMFAGNSLLTSEKTNGVSTIFMESYVLVQQAYYTSTPATLKENDQNRQQLLKNYGRSICLW